MDPDRVRVGHPAPKFTCRAVLDGRVREMSLSSFSDGGYWVILLFFPKAWSFICPTEIQTFSKRLDEFLHDRKCAIMFASTDHELCLKAWTGTSRTDGGLGNVRIPLISDCDHAISRKYGVLIEDEGTTERACFIIDPLGVVRGIGINDADIGRSVDECQRLLDAFIWKDQYGEACPVNWKNGESGIVMATAEPQSLSVVEYQKLEARRGSMNSSDDVLPLSKTQTNVTTEGNARPHGRFSNLGFRTKTKQHKKK